MKKITLLLLMVVSSVFISCNERTTESYNNQIVEAHSKLFQANEEFLNGSLSLIGKPESKKELLALITSTRNKLIEAKKPVELLAPLNSDKGLRKVMLDMFNSSITSMDGFETNIDVLTAKDNQAKSTIMLQGAFAEIVEMDETIKEIQVEYANANNAQLR
ncbi:hypothetical protein [Flavobacterium daemonense]|uniref:hypothetical protein n=1 Tax=Flavobacterium daemonense TaxID=1393049 RepID=UPI0011860C01|nr:hypothetical protein [Flavobacterium daemonense]KAF2335490.1 hypothetical protein FND99_04835 [Flavobacterium daemonense]